MQIHARNPTHPDKNLHIWWMHARILYMNTPHITFSLSQLRSGGVRSMKKRVRRRQEERKSSGGKNTFFLLKSLLYIRLRFHSVWLNMGLRRWLKKKENMNDKIRMIWINSTSSALLVKSSSPTSGIVSNVSESVSGQIACNNSEKCH